VDVTGVDTTTTVKLPFLPSSPSPSNATASAVPTWAVGIGVGFVLVGAIGIGATFYRIRSRRREQGKELVGNLLDRAGEFEEGEIIAPGGDPRPPSWNPREPR
jgi:hypothetical protein